jgi:AcrR family transcriptional regulator
VPKPSVKDALCEAAIRVAGRDGIAALSLDSVAQEAGVTKGGLLYHFKSKEELVQATLEHFARAGRQMLLEQIASDPAPHLRWARGFVSILFPSVDQLKSTPAGISPDALASFLIAMFSVASDKRFDLGPMQRLGHEFRNNLLEDKETGIEQMLVWLTIDGLLVWQMLGLIDPHEPLFAQIGAALRERVGLPLGNPAGQPSPIKKAKPPKRKTAVTRKPPAKSAAKKASGKGRHA